MCIETLVFISIAKIELNRRKNKNRFKRRPVEDSYRHKGMRKQLVKKLEAKGIESEKVLKAIGTVPRHFFFEAAFFVVAIN